MGHDIALYNDRRFYFGDDDVGDDDVGDDDVGDDDVGDDDVGDDVFGDDDVGLGLGTLTVLMAPSVI